LLRLRHYLHIRIPKVLKKKSGGFISIKDKIIKKITAFKTLLILMLLREHRKHFGSVELSFWLHGLK
jgi:hypothetical protein